MFDNKTGLEIEIQFSRQISHIILVTYFPTILMNIINQATNYFVGDEFFGDVIAVNITCMMVLSSIYIAVSGSLPPTSSIKYVEIWLLFSLIYPFLIVLVQTWMRTLAKREHVNVSPMHETQKKKKNIGMMIAKVLIPGFGLLFAVVYFIVGIFYERLE